MKKLFGFALIFVMVLSFLPLHINQTAFASDVIPNLESASTWAREGITSALSKGFVPSDIQSSYTDVISRQEFCRMAVKWVEYTAGKNIDLVLAEQGKSRNINAFTDTSDPFILSAYALGITSGTGGGKFTPNGQFSREQAATMIMNTCRVVGSDVSNPPDSGFADLGNASSWAISGINFVRAKNIMQGTGNNNFSPNVAYTREQSIITFNNINIDKITNPLIDIGSSMEIWVLESMEVDGIAVSKDEFNNLFAVGVPYIGFNEDGKVELVNFHVNYDSNNGVFQGITEHGTFTISENSISIVKNNGDKLSLTCEGDVLVWHIGKSLMRFKS